jgi:lysophospholipase L1-like esterase
MAMGAGYASLIAAELLVDRPADGLKIYNRGVSGNKVFQLAERWQADCLDLKPNILSILIGVNDFWHTVDPSQNYHGTVEIYEKDFVALLERTLKALPKVKLIIGEPFAIKNASGRWAVTDKWFPEFDKYRAAAARTAKNFHAIFVPFQAMFDEAAALGPPEISTRDGEHPREGGGTALMAHAWMKAIRA